MKKPIIAVMPLYDEEKNSYWMLPGYMKGIEKAGGIPVMLPLTANPQILTILTGTYDGFLLTGGQDVSPQIYGETVSPLCGSVCEERDEMERIIINEAIRLDKPVLGICRGIQILNAVLGGTLYQNLPTDYPSDTEHCQKPPYDVPIHKVKLVKSSPLYRLLQKDELKVNSYHHQAIKKLSEKLKSMAYSEDGLTEAVYAPNSRFIWAVQWHPEFSFESDENSMMILEEFIKSCTKNGE